MSDFFVYQKIAGELVIERIRVTQEFSREHQGELTKRLSLCSPLMKELSGWSALKQNGSLSSEVTSFLGAVSTALQRPVKAVSLGPTAEDKLFF